MRRKQRVWIIAAALVVVAALISVSLLADDVRPPRRYLPRQPGTMPCPPGAFCGQEPPAGPAFTTDGDPESEAALAEIREVLMRRGCQIAVVERINEDGTRSPKLQVERVMIFVALPADRKR